MKFTKMQGIGNDYVYVNCLKEEVKNPSETAKIVSDRHFGIGSDGLILICPSDQADFRMAMYNADGSEGAMCGNGIRCVGKYVYDHGLTDQTEITVDTLGGIKRLKLTVEDGKVSLVRVNMGEPVFDPEKIPVRYKENPVVNVPIEVNGREYHITCVSMGNPHAVVFLNNSVKDLDIRMIGPCFENHTRFPKRINTEFVEVIDQHTLKARIWERGSGETMACGTGTCAAVVAATLNGYCEKGKDIRVILKGGELKIHYTDERVLMTGKAEKVYDGVVEV